MSAAHTCIRGALIQAFRLNNSRAVSSCSVPEFLVPAVARRIRRPTRPFSSSGRRKNATTTAQVTSEPPQSSVAPRLRSGPSKPPIRSRIPFPHTDNRGDIAQWLDAIDPFLPPHLRRIPANDAEAVPATSAFDFAAVLTRARDADHEILSYYALVEQRWGTFVWIAKKLVEDGTQSINPATELEPFADVILPGAESRTLDSLTEEPLRTQRVPPSYRRDHNLDSLTAIPESIDPRHEIVKAAIGQLWRSLGNLILVASKDASNADAVTDADSTIMSHVLEIIAHLHHIGFMPNSVYTHKAPLDEHALQQPPTLHLLSTKILTALSDATWKAHEASVKVATERLNASYFLGHEIPGSRYKIQVTEVAPELWMELILWTCLHGGWLSEGSAILEQMCPDNKGHGWGLISWRELMQAKGRELERFTDWGAFQKLGSGSSNAYDRALTRRTISSEVVTAFVEGLVNTMRLGVGRRGTTPEDIVESIKKLKRFLDASSLSLGSTTWDAIMSRLLESGGIVPEKRPELLLSILDLASVFGTEVSTINAAPNSTTTESEPPYFYEPTTVPLGLLHRALRSYVHTGDLSGAMTTLKMLQQHTDHNKQKSLQQFFEALKDVNIRNDEPFTGRLPPIEFPAFENQVPVPLLARLLDLVTESKAYDLGLWFLSADDLDGPLIPPAMYSNWIMAAAIIRYGTRAADNNLVLKVIKQVATFDSTTQGQQMSPVILTALLCSQIQLHRWQSVQGMQDHVLQSPGYRPKAEILATFAAELLRLSSAPSEMQAPEKMKARKAFTQFLFTWEDLILKHARSELYCVLAILSTVHDEWQQFCSQFLALSAFQTVRLSTEDFNRILGGVLDSYGSMKGREMVDMWCYTSSQTFEAYRAAGGLPRMPWYRTTKREEYESQPDNIEVVQESGAKLVLRGRVQPNRQTVLAVLRKVQGEEDEQRGRGDGLTVAKRAEMRETLQWGADLLYHLGFDYEDVVRDLGSLAEIAELEVPPAAASVWYG